jgi:hypothetical protein
MLCENCRQREATHHETNITVICGESSISETAGNLTKSDLCDVCFEASGPDARELMAAWKAGCAYCGGEPICTTPDLSAAGGDEHKTAVVCEACNRELSRCINLKLPGLAGRSITPEQTANLKAIFSEIHEHMKKWVSERGTQ